jgi:integrase
MGCWIIKTRHGTLSLLLYYHGKKWWEGTGRHDTAENRTKLAKFKTLIAESMRRGMFEADYERFFPHGNRINEWGTKRATGQGTTLREFALVLVRERQEPLYRRSYGKNKGTHLNAWILPHLGHMPLTELRREHVVALREKIVTAGRTTKTARNILGTVQAILTEARARHLVDENVALQLHWPRQSTQKKVDPFEVEEVERILVGFRKKDPDYVYPLILALADTGMRESEATGLQWEDIDLRAKGKIVIRRSFVGGRIYAAGKTGHAERTLDGITARLRAQLDAMRPEKVTPGTPVFVGPRGVRLHQEQVQERHFTKMLEALKIRRRGMGQLRHSFISNALSAANPPAPQWLADYTGTSLEMFHRHYARWMSGQNQGDPLAWIGRPKAKVYQLPSAAPCRTRGRRG